MVPFIYFKQTSNGKEVFIQKGQLNNYRIRPAILNEHAESSREAQAVVTSSLIVGQIFKASQDNINGILLTLESNAGATLDDFESYANDAALQAVWVLAGTNLAVLETTIVKSGAQSMRLPGTTLNDEWEDTIGATNYTDYFFHFDFYQDETYTRLNYEFFIGDGANKKSIPLAVANPDQWFHFEIDENAMIDDGGTPPTMTAITEIGFRCSLKDIGDSGYVDNLIAVPSPGEVVLKLWDMGASIPLDAVTSIDDGNQYVELGDRGLTGGTVAATVILSLQGGKRQYTIRNFVAGVALEIPANTLLNVGNYYAITINYVDTDVIVYGPDTSNNINYYTNGFSFTSPNEATAITKLGTFNDCMFWILSTQDVYINKIVTFYNADMGELSTEEIFIEDKNMNITNVVVGNDPVSQRVVQLEFTDRALWFPKGGKLEVYHNDDYHDSTTLFSIMLYYLFIPPVVNG